MIHNHPVRRTVATNTISQLVGKFATAGIAFVMSVLIAARYGAAGYGDFTKITTFVAFFYLLADFGMNAIYLQQVKRSGNDQTWSALLGLRVGLSLLLVLVLLLVLALLPAGTQQGYTSLVRLGILLYCPTILFQALLTSANAQFQRHLRYEYSTVAVVVGSVVSLILLWTATQLSVNPDVGLLAVIAALGAGSFVTCMIGLFFVRRLVGVLRLVFSPRLLWQLLVQSLPLGVTLVFNLVYFRADSVILALTRSTAEVGIYGFAYKIFEVPLVLPTFFMNAVYPLILAEIRDKPKVIGNKFFNLIKKSMMFLLLISCLLSLLIWYGAPLLSLVRSEFAQSVPVLRVLSLGLPFFFLSSLSMWALISLKQQRVLAYIYGVSMLVTVGLTAWYVPRVGYMAAAWITVFSEAMVLFVSGVVLVRRLFSKDRA